jgi:hypothetical protein
MIFNPFYRRDIKVNEACLNKEDLKRLFSIVETQLGKAVKIQIETSNPDSSQDFESYKLEVNRVFVIHYNIRKKLGDEFSGYGIPNFDSSDFPERLESIYLSTRSTFEIVAKYAPRNHIEIFLDFKRARLAVDFISLPSNPTENGSIINIVGLEENWVIETYNKLKEFFDDRPNHRTYIHKSGIYDLFLYIVVFPIFLYSFYRFEITQPNFIDKVPKITIIAIYIYSFLLTNLIGRVTFQYTRWLFPLVEYTSDKRWIPNAQRALLLSVIFSVIGGALYDVIKFFFS